MLHAKPASPSTSGTGPVETGLGSEGAPVPGALKALRKAAYALALGAVGWHRRFDGLDRSLTARGAVAVAVGPAGAQVLPLTKGAVTAVAGTMPATLGVEPGKLVETNLGGRVLPAVDAAALSAVVATLKEAKGLLTRRGGADRSGAVSLTRNVSAIGLERRIQKSAIAVTRRRQPCMGAGRLARGSLPWLCDHGSLPRKEKKRREDEKRREESIAWPGPMSTLR